MPFFAQGWDVIEAYSYPYKPDCDSQPAKSRGVCITRDRTRTETGPQHLIHAHSAHPLSFRVLVLLCSTSRELLPNFKAKFKGDAWPVVLTWRLLHIPWGLTPVPCSGAGRGGKGWTSSRWQAAGLTSWQTQGQESWGQPANFPLTCLFKYWYIYPFSSRH